MFDENRMIRKIEQAAKSRDNSNHSGSIFVEALGSILGFAFFLIIAFFSFHIVAIIIVNIVFRAEDLGPVVSQSLVFKSLLCLALFLIAIGFHFLKKYRRITYSIVELGFGLASVWNGLNKASIETPSTFATVAQTIHLEAVISLIAGVYLLVRALGNFDAGLKKYREKKQSSTSNADSDN